MIFNIHDKEIKNTKANSLSFDILKKMNNSIYSNMYL
jgi:hypothetical protein